MEKLFIAITVNENVRDKLTVPLTAGINEYLDWINRKLGAETTVEYRVQDVVNLTIRYEVKYYNNQQRKLTLMDLACKKVDEITKYLSSLSNDVFPKQLLYFIRSLAMMIDNEKTFRNMLQIGIVDFTGNFVEKPKTLIVKIPTLKYPVYNVQRLCDGSVVRQLVDPYINNYGVFVDYSKPLEEFNYMYNGLHIFEHYATYAWKNLKDKNLLYYNGSTYSNGLCIVYAITKTEADAKDRLLASITFHIQSSNVDFVKRTKALQTETTRTISETYTMRNLTRLGRSDQIAYNENTYKENVIAYWSSLPMNILVVTNKLIHINTDELAKFYEKHHCVVIKPKPLNLKYFPREVFFTHYSYNLYTFRKDMKKILQKLYSNTKTTAIYGIGNRQKTSDADLSNDQNVLSQLLIFANYTDDNVVIDYIKHNVFPNDVLYFLDYKSTNVLQYVNDCISDL